ncbi:MAG: hypothetical protein LBU60_01810 [Clostridiales bacterium]|nr:hypothetical protein [Clostridiales bacterium]
MNNFNVAILLSGDGQSCQSLIHDKSDKFKVVAVLSSNENANGLFLASQAKIECGVFKLADFSDASQRDLAIVSLLKRLKVNLVVCSGYLGVLTDCFFDKENNFDIICSHQSLFPTLSEKGIKGIKLHQVLIDLHHDESGVTVCYQTDTGPGDCVCCEKIAIHKSWTAQKLQHEIVQMENRLLRCAVLKICN